MIEIPIGVRLTKRLNEQYNLLFDLSPGFNYVLSNDNITRRSVTTDLSSNSDRSNKFQMVRSTNLNYFAQSRINLQSKISENKSLLFFIAYQHQFTDLFRYRTYNTKFDFYGNPLRPHYFSLGFSYQFSLREKK